MNAHPRAQAFRLAAAWALTIAGLLAYNWWVLALLRPGLVHSPNELFSNLEVTGQPYATAMQHADLLSGLLLLLAFLAAGTSAIPHGRPEALAMMSFAVAAGLGGLFPETCADTISTLCRDTEWKFQLPLHQYLHMAAGIAEFSSITIALLLAVRRTRRQGAFTARLYRDVATAAAAAYPLLGLAYLVNRLGGVMEAAFSVAFTVIVLAQISERAHQTSATRHLSGAGLLPAGATHHGRLSRGPAGRA